MPRTVDADQEERIKRFDAVIAGEPREELIDPVVEKPSEEKVKDAQCIVCNDGAVTLHGLFCDDGCMNEYNDKTNYGKEIDSYEHLPTWDEVKTGKLVADTSKKIQEYRVKMIRQKEELTLASRRAWSDGVNATRETEKQRARAFK